jgi:GNAT superfamily N-acetyltransferase
MLLFALLTSRIKNKLSAILTILYCAGIKISYLLAVIRQIKREELSLVRDFAPPDWNTNLEELFGRYYDQSWFYAVIEYSGEEVVGTGMAVVHGNCAWIGTIIVRDAWRGQGIGRRITQHLTDHVQQKGDGPVLLSASHAGKPLYAKMGFATDSHYVFLKPATAGLVVPVTAGLVVPATAAGYISPITPKDHEAIIALDHSLSGEERSGLLLNSFSNGYKYADGPIRGYYLPALGKGLIIADTERAGIELLKFKVSREGSMVCIPEANTLAMEFLVSIGYQPYLTATRMYLGKNIVWQPGKVYARGSGALG